MAEDLATATSVRRTIDHKSKMNCTVIPSSESEGSLLNRYGTERMPARTNASDTTDGDDMVRRCWRSSKDEQRIARTIAIEDGGGVPYSRRDIQGRTSEIDQQYESVIGASIRSKSRTIDNRYLVSHNDL